MTFLLMLYLILLCVLFLIFLGWWWFNCASETTKFYDKLKIVPGLPFLGIALDVRNSKTLLDVIMGYKENYGDLFNAKIGPIMRKVIVADYKLMEFLLSSQKALKKSTEYKYFHSWLGTGLLTSAGTKWKKRRRIITPAFHFKILEDFIDVFEANGNVLLKKLDENLGENTDIYPLITLYALDVICGNLTKLFPIENQFSINKKKITETAMGTSINAQNNSNSKYVQSVKEMCRIVVERSVSPIEMFDFLYRFTRNYRIERKSLNILHEFTMKVIKQRKQEKQKTHNTEMVNSEDEMVIGKKRKQAFLNLLLDATIDNRPLTVEEIREEVDTFMFEGHDTTTSAISFTLFCLANHADVQERVYQEQRNIFGDSPTVAPIYQDLLDMKYLELVIKEALRLYPSVPIIGRETEEEIDFDELKIPKGVTFLLFPYGIQRDPKYFTNPNEFQPSRFEAIDGKLPFSYVPFSAGPRNCIGQKFAMLEMKSVISKIIRNFVLSPAVPEHKLQLACEIILKSANGIRIGLRRR